MYKFSSSPKLVQVLGLEHGPNQVLNGFKFLTNSSSPKKA